MFALFSLFADPPIYVGPGQPAAATVDHRCRGLFGIWPSSPEYVGGGEGLSRAPCGGISLGFFPTPPIYLAPTPAVLTDGAIAPMPADGPPPVPETERRVWDRE